MSPKLLPELKNRYGFVVIIFPNDHLPAHVYHGEKVARINFEPHKLDVMDSKGFTRRELNEICKLLTSFRPYLIEVWNVIHPDTPFNPSLTDVGEDDSE
jgi:hypothetical protein